MRISHAILSAAVSGITLGASQPARAVVADPFATSPSSFDGATPMDADAGAKHACKGQNACKGQGGCKTGDAKCAGKNSCKGKGGCAVPKK